MFKQPDFFVAQNGNKGCLPFSEFEYARRLEGLRTILRDAQLDAALITSMHGVAYYTGFLYCSFGRPYACVVTQTDCTTVSANIDGGQPWRRSVADNVIYTDWRRDNFWRAVRDLLPASARLGIEADHLTLAQQLSMQDMLELRDNVDIAAATMRQRMIKSAEELALIRLGARVADHGGEAVRAAIRAGATETEIARAGRNAMEIMIDEQVPDGEMRDTWVWFQSGINTDGAHNPLTTRRVEPGDILSLNTFPMISGYYTALERTLFLGEPDAASLGIWEANIAAHELGQSLIKPGQSCQAICAELNRFFEECGLLQYRTFGYGHSFGLLSHYYGREAGLELREDIETVLAPGMVISMEPMLTIPQGRAGAGGYREHDILIVTQDGAENITHFPYGPEHNVIDYSVSAPAPRLTRFAS